MKHLFCYFSFLLSIQAQFQVNVVKESTNEPLAFATITSDGSTTISDVDGKFSISSKKHALF
jgi:hypothetical protein